MAHSCKPGPTAPPLGLWRVPARTVGVLGCDDQGDPDVTSLLGDTPGPLGLGDWGAPAKLFGGVAMPLLRPVSCAADGTALAPATAAVSTAALTWNDIQADFQKWEALVTHLYLDTVGNVTVGIGNLLATAAAAQTLAFVRRKDGQAATADEIKAEFDKVAALDSGNYKASWYRDKTTLDLPEANCWALLKKRIDDQFLPGLEGLFSGWSALPLPVKRALLDMGYNLGLGSAKHDNGLRAYKSLKKSVQAADWKTAATQCHRKGISDSRNDWTRDLFLAAAGPAK